MVKQISGFFSVTVLLAILFSACEKTKSKPLEETFQYASFRDIPGVTGDDIKAIEALQKQRTSFVYGMPLSTEAFEGENGETRGYAAMLCEWLTNLFGIPFQPRLYKWLDLLAGLETKEISFTGELTATPERLAAYYMTSDIASRPLKQYRLADSRPLSEIARDRPVRCGFIVGRTVMISTVSSTMESGTFEVVLLSDASLVYDALKNGEIDAFYYSGTVEANFVQHADVLDSNFYPLLYRPASLATQDPALLPIVSVVEKALENDALRYLVKLYNTGYQEYLLHKMFARLNEEERRYIKDHPVVPFAAENSNYPVSFYNSREGQWQGIAFDVLREVEALTGLRFERVNDENSGWPAVLKALEDGEASMITELMHTPQRDGKFLWADTANMVSYSALISKSDLRNIVPNEILFMRVGLITGYGHTDLFRKWFPNHFHTVEYESSLAAFNALDRDEVDLVMTSSHELLIMTNYMERTGYKINYIFDNSFNSAFGFNRDSAVLCSIVDKALRLVDTKMISDQWMRRTYDYRSKLAEAQYPWFIRSLVLFLGVLVLLAVLFIRNRRASKLLEMVVRKRTHELELRNVTLTTLFDSIPDLIFTIDKSLFFTNCNKSFLGHFGLKKEDLIGKGEGILWGSAGETEEHVKWNLKVIEEHQTHVVEERIPGIDGTMPLFETVKTPLMLNGEVIGLLGIAHDITERKKMEEAALAASRSKSAFLANMSHEIRTPMNSIVGFSELAMDDDIPPKTRDYLEKIQTSAGWLLQIINDILDVSKVESGKIELENIPFDMHDLFSTCRTLVLPKALEKGLILHFYAEPSLGKKTLGDPTRLRQVFVNLLSNAIKFTNTGMVKLHSAITGTTKNTVSMHFEVKDSGIGMTPEQMEKIFDPFTQAESGTTRKYGGTGLGLVITKSIVELMGGELSVESAPGVGSKFSFDLTFETIDRTSEDLYEKNIVLKELKKPAFEGEILLCEDNVMNQQVITEHLARVGLKTVVADNGKAGVEMVQSRMEEGKKQFDLIFMDMHMPVMDGLEAAEKILALNTGIPMVAMTANIMSNDREIYRQKGMNDCVGKPFTSQELWRCLMKYFKPINWQKEDETRITQAENKLRQKLIANFVKDNQGRYNEIADAVRAGDIKLAHRLAHTLKSNAGQLGKTLLQQAAAEVEYQLKDGQNLVTPQQAAALETELNAALAELAAEIPAKAGTNSASPVGGGEASMPIDSEFARDMIEKLGSMLEMGNLECRGHIDSLRRIPGTEALIRQMEDLEFEEALATLAGLKKNAGMK
jgi:PAS domain S-box-containing protein